MPLEVTPQIIIGDHEIAERFVRASGPGGQNVNKVATAVELRFDVAASSLPAEMKARLIEIAGSRIVGDGVLVIDSREHRTQAQNREAARARLVVFLRLAAIRPKKRHKTRPSRASKERRLTDKKRQAETKAGRRTVED